jgi:small subunit ribosomal protein S7
MRYVLQKIRRRQSRSLLDNYYWQLWFRYHTVFFGSLISSGNKLRAFNMFVLIKQGLKLKELIDPVKSFLVSMMMITPNIYLLPLKLGGRSVGVPMPITEKKKVTMGVRFILKLLRERAVSLSVKSVVDTLVSSIYGRGLAIERKQSIYKNGIINRHLLKKMFKRNKRNKFDKKKKKFEDI